MAKAVVRDRQGKPFGSWKPAQKFEYVWRLETPKGSKPKKEYLFTDEAKWRFDFAWPQFKVAVEIQGFGANSYGRHQRAAGVTEDNRKCNKAAELGWIVLRYDTAYLGSRERVSEAVAQVLNVIMMVAQRD